MIRLVSWNINGIRAALKKGMWQSIKEINPDVLCVQEIKADNEFMAGFSHDHEDYLMQYFSARNRKGYSGVANFTHSKFSSSLDQAPLSFEPTNQIIEESDITRLKLINTVFGTGKEEFDIEGRLICSMFEVQNHNKINKIALLNGYYPQGGRGPERIEYKIKFYKEVYNIAQDYRSKGYKVILCGDFNTTVGDIDLARPNENRKTTGCLPEEREALQLFLQGGYIDTFRYFYPDLPNMYSYWDQITRARERNVGWRIDYFIVDDEIINYIKDGWIWMNIMGSDHCPVGIDLDL